MNIVNILRKAEAKLAKEASRVAHQLSSVRSAIGALAGKTVKGMKGKRKLSKAARAKIAKAQRARWAKVRAAKKFKSKE